MDKVVDHDCPRCLYDVARIRQNGPHLQLVCDSCGRHIRFLSKREAARFETVDLQPTPAPTPGTAGRWVTDAQRVEISDILAALEDLHGGRRFNPSFAEYTDRIRRILDV